MFSNLDKSPFNDSTGLKFIEYLTNKHDGSKRPTRSRRQIFQLQANDATSDEFSIRKIAEKENTQIVTRSSSSPKKTPSVVRQERSSTFKPIHMSTPMVPTTTQTPYRASKKSIGIQNSPLVEEMPCSQEREIPETPEVVPVAVPPKSAVTVVLPQDILPPPAQFMEVERIYPELQNVERQQEALPAIVAPVIVPQESTKTAPPLASAIISPELPPPPPPPPMVEFPPHTTTSPLPPPPSDIAQTQTPAVAPQSPGPSRWDKLMAIIHQEPAELPPSSPPPQMDKQMEEIAALIQTPRSVPEQRHIHTPRNLANELIPKTPAAQEAPLGEVPANADTPAVAGKVMHFNDSSFFIAPTPVLKNFKLVMEDCASNIATPANSTVLPRISKARASVKAPAKQPKSIRRASEMTVSQDNRRSSVVRSSQKRKLHSTVRELTPIRSPLVPGNNDNSRRSEHNGSLLERTLRSEATARGQEEEEMQTDQEQAKSNTIEPVFKKPTNRAKAKKSTAVPTPTKNRATDIESGTEDGPSSSRSRGDDERVSLVTETKRRPGPKSKTQRPPELTEAVEIVPDVQSILNDWTGDTEGNAEEIPATQPEPVLVANDDNVFKKPAPPKQRKKRGPNVKPKKAAVAEAAASSSSDETIGEIRRSGRVSKPVAEVLPFYMMDSIRSSQPSVRSVNYNPRFKEFCQSVRDLSSTKAKTAETKKKSTTKKSTSSEVLKDVRNLPEEPPADKEPATNKRAKTTAKKTTKKSHSNTADKAFDALKKAVVAAETETADLPTVTEESPLPVVPMSSPVRGKRAHASSRVTSMTRSRCTSIASSAQTTYRNNFSGNMPPSCSTEVDWSAASTTSAMVTITKTLDMGPLADLAEERVRHLEFSGGRMLTYPDYSKGIIVLETKKHRARVKRRPLVLNVASGTVIVNLESEKRAVRLSELDEISIPEGMWYSLENIGDKNSVLMFTWC